MDIHDIHQSQEPIPSTLHATISWENQSAPLLPLLFLGRGVHTEGGEKALNGIHRRSSVSGHSKRDVCISQGSFQLQVKQIPTQPYLNS